MSDSDDIVIIEKSAPEPSRPKNDDICQVCYLKLRGLNASQRQKHYSEHSSGKPISGSSLKRGRPRPTVVISEDGTSPMKLGKSPKKHQKEDVFWYPARAEAPPDNYSPGVLAVLKDALKKSHKKGTIKRAILCYERTPHISRETFDSGWGCAYRNFLMVCAALMDQQDQTAYHQNLEKPSPPGVSNLQSWIEEAWRHGYDNSGARELDSKLENSKKKIGTGDLYVAFTSRKIPCMLVDFDIKKSPKGFNTLIEWVVDYYTERLEGDAHTVLLRNANPVLATRKMPIIMQWDGHSVTIVGFELGKNGKYGLLVFDPSSKVDDGIRQAALSGRTSANGTSSTALIGSSNPRGRSKSPAAKRPRTKQDLNIVNISDSDDEKPDEARPAVVDTFNVDPDKVIKSFRPKAGYTKRSDYQLLYFTMGNPLSDLEQDGRKVVLSDRMC